MAAKDELGRRGEELASAFLTTAGYSILDRNWRCASGEIDIVAYDGACIVFVEVKTRSSVLFGHPLEAITPSKLARLRRLAGLWCEQRLQQLDEVLTSAQIRIDAIGIVVESSGGPLIEHREGVF